MQRATRSLVVVLTTLLALPTCRRGAPTSPAVSAPSSTSAVAAASAAASASASASAPIPAPSASAAPSTRPIGPYETPFLAKRTVYYVVPASTKKPQRLMANLHGVCNPPGYACGYWAEAAGALGFLVCPTGNDTCGKAMYDAPTWTENESKMDQDLEAAIATVDGLYPGEITRDDAVLTGFSKGAYAAVKIAGMHPGRWPYLVLNEASVQLSVKQLKDAKVRAVALIAGEIGSQVGSERATVKALEAQGYPARLWVMPKAGHHYSENIGDIMREAIEWVTSHRDP